MYYPHIFIVNNFKLYLLSHITTTIVTVMMTTRRQTPTELPMMVSGGPSPVRGPALGGTEDGTVGRGVDGRGPVVVVVVVVVNVVAVVVVVDVCTGRIQ